MSNTFLNLYKCCFFILLSLRTLMSIDQTKSCQSQSAWLKPFGGTKLTANHFWGSLEISEKYRVFAYSCKFWYPDKANHTRMCSKASVAEWVQIFYVWRKGYGYYTSTIFALRDCEREYHLLPCPTRPTRIAGRAKGRQVSSFSKGGLIGDLFCALVLSFVSTLPNAVNYKMAA